VGEKRGYASTKIKAPRWDDDEKALDYL